jgi:hypothetical protein
MTGGNRTNPKPKHYTAGLLMGADAWPGDTLNYFGETWVFGADGQWHPAKSEPVRHPLQLVS